MKWRSLLYTLLKTAAVAAAYFATAQIGFLFAVPPGNVTLVWIPSGIALVAMFLAPSAGGAGIWLGSFAANVHNLGLNPAALAGAAVIATGSTLQAAAISILLKRSAFYDFEKDWQTFVNWSPTTFSSSPPRISGLWRERGKDLAWLLKTIGFACTIILATFIAALFGVGSLVAIEKASRENVFSLFLTWWLGDLGGILLVGAPVLAAKKFSDIAQTYNRLRRQHMTLAKLALNPVLRVGDRPAAYRAITEAAAQNLGVSRASIWFYDHERSALRCDDLFEMPAGKHSAGLKLQVADYPRYFDALAVGRMVAAHDAPSDARTREFAEGYLKPLGITSMLDAPVRTERGVVGVICCEHTGTPRQWTLDEQNFAASLADLIALSLEITERKAVEATLVEQEERFRMLVETTANLRFFITNVERSKWFYTSPAMRDFWGLEKDAVLDDAQITAIDRGAVTSEYRQAYLERSERERRGDAVEMTYRQKHALLGERWSHTRTRGVRQPDGSVRVYGYSEDITERKQAEAALRASERQLSNALQLAKAGQWTFDVATDEFTFNDIFYQLLRTTAADLGGYRMKSADYAQRFVAPEAQAIVTEGVKHALESGDPDFVRELEHPFLRADGTTGIMAVRYALSKDETVRAVHLFGVNQDITERKQAETILKDMVGKLNQSNAELEQFAYVASHDLQEPLRAISGCVQLLERRHGKDLDLATRELIQHTVEGVARMQNLINDLLAYSRLSNTAKLDQATSLENALSFAQRNLAASIKEANASITHDDLPTVKADRSQMTQLFQNLLGNAIKFRAHRRPEIHISAQRDTDGWKISVRDNGIGIESEYFERIFRVFQRLHTREKYAGTGIGLAICKKIVEKHGGRIWLESVLGQGTTFFFTIPDTRQTHQSGQLGGAA